MQRSYKNAVFQFKMKVNPKYPILLIQEHEDFFLFKKLVLKTGRIANKFSLNGCIRNFQESHTWKI